MQLFHGVLWRCLERLETWLAYSVLWGFNRNDALAAAVFTIVGLEGAQKTLLGLFWKLALG